MLDPVFLLDSAHWRSIAKSPAHIDKPYLLVYDFDNSYAVKAIAEKVASEHGLKIYSVFDLPYAERCFTLCGPEEFLGLIQGCIIRPIKLVPRDGILCNIRKRIC